MPHQHSLLLDDPWQVRAADFPEAGSVAEKLLFLLNYAVLAPSILNTEPWRFRVVEDAVALHADSARTLPVVDPEGRELTLSCGAALLNLRAAVRGFGFEAMVEILPIPGDADLLALLRLGSAISPSDLDRRLRDAIPKRRTTRQTFEDRPLPQELLADLSDATSREGATLTFLDRAEEKRRMAGLVADAERIHLADPAFRGELSTWMRQRAVEAHARNGEADWRLGAGHTPGSSAEPGPFTPMAAAIARSFADGSEAAVRERSRAEAAPALALLATPGDGRGDWLVAGQALQRALLVATAAGVSASYLNPPIELPSLRPRVGEAFSAPGVPQVLLRLGYAPKISPAPRRPVGQVLA